MTIVTSTFRPSTSVVGEFAGDMEMRSAGSAVNFPNASIARVGNTSTSPGTHKAFLALRFDLTDSTSGPSLFDSATDRYRPKILKARLELVSTFPPVLNGPTIEIRLGAMLVKVVAWVFDSSSFGTVAYPLKSSAPFPASYDDIVIAGTLQNESFMSSVAPITIDSGDTAGTTYEFIEGFSLMVGRVTAVMTDFVQSIQDTVDLNLYLDAFTTAYGLVIDAVGLSGDTGPEEYVTVATSAAAFPEVFSPVLTIEWDDGVPLVDAGPNDTVIEDTLSNLAGSATFLRGKRDLLVSVEFDNDNDQTVSSSTQLLGIANTWSIMLWVNPADVPSGFEILMTLDGFGTVRNRIQFNISAPSPPNRDFNVALIDSTSTIFKQMNWDDLIPADTWSNIIVTFNGVADELKVYLNNVDQGAPDSAPTDNPGTMADHPRFVYLAQGSLYTGLIHQVAIWNKVLFTNERAFLQDPGRELDQSFGNYFGKDNLQHWYRLGNNVLNIGEDYGNGSPLIDISGAGIDSDDITVEAPATSIFPFTLWSVTIQPGGSVVFFSDLSDVLSLVSFDTEGSYTLQLLADDVGLTATDTVNYTVIMAALLEFHCIEAGVAHLVRVDAISATEVRVEVSAGVRLGLSAKVDSIQRVDLEALPVIRLGAQVVHLLAPSADIGFLERVFLVLDAAPRVSVHSEVRQAPAASPQDLPRISTFSEVIPRISASFEIC